jgi:DNA invertase Pin-like site-specific DNA recombinase
MIRAVIYSRVSTSQQDAANQTAVLKEWARQRGFEVVAVYTETESAWRDGHQQELARLVRDARKGRFSIVLIWALDRLSRLGALSILSLIHKLANYGVKVLSHEESWTEAPGELAEVLFAIAGWVARMESQRRSERTKAGLVRVRASGRKLGRPYGAKDRKKRKKRSVRNGLLLSTDLSHDLGL